MMEDHIVQTITARNSDKEEAFPLRTQEENFEGTDVGGNSSHWSGVTHRATAFDFEARSITVEKYGEDKIPKEMFLQDWGILCLLELLVSFCCVQIALLSHRFCHR